MAEIQEHAWLAEPHEVQAILAGRQSQFRRPVEAVRLFSEEYDRRWYPHVIPPGRDQLNWAWFEGPPHGPSCYELKPCPWGNPGDRLWVQEEFGYTHVDNAVSAPPAPHDFLYKAGRNTLGAQIINELRCTEAGIKPPEWPAWLPGSDMPRWASRLLLEVEHVRVERLHDIKDKDALKEGVEVVGGGRYALGAPCLQPQGSLVAAYQTVHARQYGPEWWALNEWYWIVKFRVIEQPAR